VSIDRATHRDFTPHSEAIQGFRHAAFLGLRSADWVEEVAGPKSEDKGWYWNVGFVWTVGEM
jgi:hypothetical protein